MSKKKGNAADLAPSRKEKKGIGQYVLGFFLLLYTLFCFLPVLLVFIAAFTDEGAEEKNFYQLCAGSSYGSQHSCRMRKQHHRNTCN